jgi:hypothetical protein
MLTYIQGPVEVSSSRSKRKLEEVPIASEASVLTNEHGKRMRFDTELIDSSPEDPCALLQLLINKLLRQAIVSRAQRESDAARQYLTSLNGAFGELDFSQMSDPNLHSLLNVHRNEYLGNLAKTHIYHTRAMQAQKVAESLAKLLKARQETAMVVEGVRDLSLERSPQATVDPPHM